MKTQAENPIYSHDDLNCKGKARKKIYNAVHMSRVRTNGDNPYMTIHG